VPAGVPRGCWPTFGYQARPGAGHARVGQLRLARYVQAPGVDHLDGTADAASVTTNRTVAGWPQDQDAEPGRHGHRAEQADPQGRWAARAASSGCHDQWQWGGAEVLEISCGRSLRA
jgi:hypothetical protein